MFICVKLARLIQCWKRLLIFLKYRQQLTVKNRKSQRLFMTHLAIAIMFCSHSQKLMVHISGCGLQRWKMVNQLLLVEVALSHLVKQVKFHLSCMMVELPV